MDFSLFNWAQMWDVAGPFIIMGIVAIVLGFVCAAIMATLPKWLKRELFSVASILIVIGGALGALYIAAGIWGYKF